MPDENLSSKLNTIHARIMDGSRAASRDLVLTGEKPLTGFVASRFRSLRPDQVRDVAIDAIMEYLEAPEVFDPSRASLWTYLCGIAWNLAAQLVRNEGNRARLAEESADVIELWQRRANNIAETDAKIDLETILRRSGATIAQSDQEREVLALMLLGERETALYARILGVAPDAPDTASEVKRIKDRLNSRLRKVLDEF